MCKTISMHYENLFLEETPSKTASHRTTFEQILGLCIFFFISFSAYGLHIWIAEKGLTEPWYLTLTKATWIIQSWAENPLWLIFYLLPSISTWLVWKRLNIVKIKLELSLLSLQIFFQIFWTVSFFYLQNILLSLFTLLFSLSNIIILGLILQKNEKKTKPLVALAFFWLFYMTGINIMFCLTNH